MEVVLLERVAKLGQMGDVVTVKDGYARNFLLPQGKALRANERNLKIFDEQKAQIEAKNLELKKEADAVADKLNGEAFVVLRQAGESGILYGSVSSRDIAQVVTDGGFTVARAQVTLNTPIKALGLHEVLVRLHPEVEVTITMNVARTADEAERQARGEDVTASTLDEDEADILAMAEEVFESEELAKEAAAELGEGEEGEAAAEEAGEEEEKTEE